MTTLFHRKLFVVYNRAIAKARRSGNDPKLIQRLHKAFSILQSNQYYQDEKSLYHPTTHSCNCKDWEYRHAHKRGYTGYCGHVIAEILLERVNQVSYKQMSFV